MDPMPPRRRAALVSLPWLQPAHREALLGAANGSAIGADNVSAILLMGATQKALRVGSVNDPAPKRPLGMQRRTYERLRTRLVALESRLSRCLKAKKPDYENLSYYVQQ